MTRSRAKRSLIIFLVLACTLVSAALQESWGKVADISGNSVELGVDYDLNVFTLYFSDEYGVNTQLVMADPNEMKRLRVSYRNAKQKASRLRKGQSDHYGGLQILDNTITFHGAEIAGDNYVLIRVQSSDTVDENSFSVPISFGPNSLDSQRLRKKKFEALLELTNQ